MVNSPTSSWDTPPIAIALALAGSFEVAPATIQGFDANYEQLAWRGVVESRCWLKVLGDAGENMAIYEL